jgi:hypothetical protein
MTWKLIENRTWGGGVGVSDGNTCGLAEVKPQKEPKIILTGIRNGYLLNNSCGALLPCQPIGFDWSNGGVTLN